MIGYLIFAIVWVALDQGVKFLVRAAIPLHTSQTFLPGLFDLTYIRNTGAAFSILRSQTWLLTVLSGIAVVVLLATKVLPVFDGVFAQLGAKMGPVATGMMHAGQSLAKVGTGLAIAVAVLAVIAVVVALVPALRERFARWVRRTFGGRGILGQMAVSRFASSMSMAAASGMSMEESVELSAKLCGGAREIDEKTAKCRERILDGVSAADALSESGLFSSRDCRLMKLAEQTGTLYESLEDIAGRQEEESLRKIDRLVGAIEPAIVVITSVLAGVILISVMLPLMGLLSAAG